MTGPRTSATGDPPREPVLVPADLLRLAALLSVVVAALGHGWLGFALFFLVLGGTFLPRALGTPAPVDAAYSGAILFGAWAAQLDWYLAVPGLDIVVHAVATGLVAAVATDALRRVGVVPAAPGAGDAGLARDTTVVGAVLAVVWEVGEWLGHVLVDDRIQVGVSDTVSDLVAGVVGAFVAGVLAGRSAAVDHLDMGGADRALPTVSVVIPVRDDAEELRACLELLDRQTVAPWEVVVVDNASADDTAAVARAHGARVVHEPRVGIPPAAATGYDTARGDVIARCDADTRPGPDWVERIARTSADDTIDALTGTGTFHDLPRVMRMPVMASYLGSYYLLTHLAVGNRPLWGSSMAVRRSSWLRVRHLVHTDADVHDDMDLAFALGPQARIVLDRRLRVGVSARSVRGASQMRRRLRRAVVTLRLNWTRQRPWERWRERLRR